MSDKPNNLITENAVITGAEISNDNHGLLSAWVYLDFELGSQGFGGYALYLLKSFTHHKKESPAGHFIFRTMQIAGVSKWSELAGKTVRVKHNNSTVWEIGHIVKDDWFCPSEDFEEMKG